MTSTLLSWLLMTDVPNYSIFQFCIRFGGYSVLRFLYNSYSLQKRKQAYILIPMQVALITEQPYITQYYCWKQKCTFRFWTIVSKDQWQTTQDSSVSRRSFNHSAFKYAIYFLTHCISPGAQKCMKKCNLPKYWIELYSCSR